MDTASTPRAGPRPLALHLGTTAALWLSSLSAWPGSRSGSSESNKPWLAQDPELAAALAKTKPEAFFAAVAEEALARIGQAWDGIQAYRRHPFRRDVEDPPVAWSEGTTKLRDFGGDGPPVLMMPSLVNRWQVVDISEKKSFLRSLKRAGYRPMVVDWDAPGPLERGYTLTDYVLRGERLLAAAREKAGGEKLHLMGYCMGGDLALALALRRQEDLLSLALHATPWDFHAEKPGIASLFFTIRSWTEAVIEHHGELPLDLLQAFFLALDPGLSDRKFRKFATLDPESEGVKDFIALEDWLNEGMPLAAAVARECLFAWYGENTPARLQWRIGGEVVDPGKLRLPALIVVPGTDRIVPPPSARALAAAIPGAEHLEPPLGHIGMMVSGAGAKMLTGPVLAWLDARR